MMGQPQPRIHHKVITVMAGDHGVVAEGVSAYPQVTPQMVKTSHAAQRSTLACHRRPGSCRRPGVPSPCRPSGPDPKKIVSGRATSPAVRYDPRSAERAVWRGQKWWTAVARGLDILITAIWASAIPRLGGDRRLIGCPPAKSWTRTADDSGCSGRRRR
jgi:hypothetical protein